MTPKKFTEKISKTYNNINSPEHHDAPMPPYDKKRINPSKFADELRPKYVEFDYDGDQLYVKWLSQEWCKDRISFFVEIKRYLEQMAKIYELEGEVFVDVSIHDRNNTGFDSSYFVVTA